MHSSIHVHGLDFSQHETPNRGGAIEMGRNTFAAFDTCSFKENGGYGGGGAIFADFGGNVNIVSSEFIANAAYRGPGGAIGTRAELHVSNSRFIGNRAMAGGAVWVEKYPMLGFENDISRFDGCEFIKNLATAVGGGAIGILAANVAVFGGVFSDNRASPDRLGGGAVLTTGGGSLKVHDITASFNYAAGVGDTFTIDNHLIQGMNVSLRNITYAHESGMEYHEGEDQAITTHELEVDSHDFGMIFVTGKEISSCAIEPCPLHHECIETVGNSECRACPSLHVSLDGLECHLGKCPPGMQGNADGSSCEKCPVDTVSNSLALAPCELCDKDGGWEATPDQQECICGSGFFSVNSTGAEDPDGLQRSLDGLQSCVQCDLIDMEKIHGGWVDPEAIDGGIFCPGASVEPDGWARMYPTAGWYIDQLPGYCTAGTECTATGDDAVLYPAPIRCLELVTCLGCHRTWTVATDGTVVRDEKMTTCSELMLKPGGLALVRDVLSRYRVAEFNLTGISGTVDLSSAPDSVLSKAQLSTSQFCHPNSLGALCALCDDGHDTKVKGLCANCKTTPFGVAKVIVMAMVMTLFLYWKGGQIDVRSDGGKLSILIFFFQALMQLADRSGPNAFFGLRGLLDNFLSMEVSTGGASPRQTLLACQPLKLG